MFLISKYKLLKITAMTLTVKNIINKSELIQDTDFAIDLKNRSNLRQKPSNGNQLIQITSTPTKNENIVLRNL